MMGLGKLTRLREREVLAAGAIEHQEALCIELSLRQRNGFLELTPAGPRSIGLELERAHPAASPRRAAAGGGRSPCSQRARSDQAYGQRMLHIRRCAAC